ncbi:hypothetical protein ZWY2020_006378 [Hordeum vulgare]|nr:hypothetical protein ZWY2020_006378 [Hordeum vulgare]
MGTPMDLLDAAEFLPSWALTARHTVGVVPLKKDYSLILRSNGVKWSWRQPIKRHRELTRGGGICTSNGTQRCHRAGGTSAL